MQSKTFQYFFQCKLEDLLHSSWIAWWVICCKVARKCGPNVGFRSM